MNVFSLLILKQDVYVLTEGNTVRQAVETMNFHHYQNIPILTQKGCYVNSISSGDLLSFMSKEGIDLREAEQVAVEKVPIYRPIKALSTTASIEEIRDCLLDQNYVPLVDDQGVFFGIITRRRFVANAMELKK